MLYGEMVELFIQGRGVIQEVDHGVKAVDHPQSVGVELGAGGVGSVHALEQLSGSLVVLKQTETEKNSDLKFCTKGRVTVDATV